jgi:hypothetical protein
LTRDELELHERDSHERDLSDDESEDHEKDLSDNEEL